MIFVVHYISGDTSLPDGHFSPESDLLTTSGIHECIESDTVYSNYSGILCNCNERTEMPINIKVSSLHESS